MQTNAVKEFLDHNQVKYMTIQHSPAYTAQEIAAASHVPGKELAKTVMVRVDGRLAMAVVPANHKVDLKQLQHAAEAEKVEIADEMEFRDLFPYCEPGAMPPFGNLYGMPVYVDDSLAQDDQIAFNACSHSELIQLNVHDFQRLVNPVTAHIT